MFQSCPCSGGQETWTGKVRGSQICSPNMPTLDTVPCTRMCLLEGTTMSEVAARPVRSIWSGLRIWGGSSLSRCSRSGRRKRHRRTGTERHISRRRSANGPECICRRGHSADSPPWGNEDEPMSRVRREGGSRRSRFSHRRADACCARSAHDCAGAKCELHRRYTRPGRWVRVIDGGAHRSFDGRQLHPPGHRPGRLGGEIAGARRRSRESGFADRVRPKYMLPPASAARSHAPHD